MNNQPNKPSGNGSAIPFPRNTPLHPLSPAKQKEIPTELKELDGAPIAAALPDANELPATGKVLAGKEPAEITEFNLHPDGTVMKYIARPDAGGKSFAPQCLLVDGAGRQYGVIRNSAVADLICNGVNMMHLARVQMEAEIAAQNKPVDGGAPNLIVQPHVAPEKLN